MKIEIKIFEFLICQRSKQYSRMRGLMEKVVVTEELTQTENNADIIIDSVKL